VWGSRFWGARFWSARYWSATGATPAAPDRAQVRLLPSGGYRWESLGGYRLVRTGT